MSSAFVGMQTLPLPVNPAGHEPRHVSLYKNRGLPQVRHCEVLVRLQASQPVKQPRHVFVLGLLTY